jgi:hypothetical protein
LTTPQFECGHADTAAAADSTRMPLRRAHEQAWQAADASNRPGWPFGHQSSWKNGWTCRLSCEDVHGSLSLSARRCGLCSYKRKNSSAACVHR